MTFTASLTLDEQRAEYARRRFLAMPLSGAIVWFVIAIASLYLSPLQIALVTFIGTGSIFYLAVMISRYTGESLLGGPAPKNAFDSLFFHSMFASWLVFAIAIPFFQVDYSSLPLTVGILTGTMWLVFSWIIQHPIGTLHAVVRTGLIVICWYAFPSQRFLVIPLVIVFVYLISIYALERRWRAMRC